MASTGETLFQLAYQISPIILHNGIASFVPKGYLPLAALTEAGNYSLDATFNFIFSGNTTNYQPFAYKPLPGSTLLDFDIATYPFANLQMAANAVVQNPLKISILMTCPAQNGGGYILKQALLTGLQTALQNHVLMGGSFSIITPAYTYTDCLLTTMIDVTSPSDEKVQEVYQLNFIQPLLTQSAATSTLSTSLNRTKLGLPTTGEWTSPATSIIGQ